MSSDSTNPGSPTLRERASSMLTSMKSYLTGDAATTQKPLDATKMGTGEGGWYSTKNTPQSELPLHHHQPSLNQLNRDVDVVMGRESNTADQNISVSEHLKRKDSIGREDDEKASQWRLMGSNKTTTMGSPKQFATSYPHVYNSTVNTQLHKSAIAGEGDFKPELHHKWHDSHLDVAEEKSNSDFMNNRHDKLGHGPNFVEDVKAKLGMQSDSAHSQAIYHDTPVDSTAARRSTATSDFVRRALTGWSDQ